MAWRGKSFGIGQTWVLASPWLLACWVTLVSHLPSLSICFLT